MDIINNDCRSKTAEIQIMKASTYRNNPAIHNDHGHINLLDHKIVLVLR